MLETVKHLFDAWNSHPIRYCHWKSSDHLEATVNGLTDLDVLVDRETARVAERLAEEVGFRRMDTVPLRSYPGIMDYICLDPSGTWVHIHLHYQLLLGDRWVKAYHLPLERQLLENAVYSDRFQSYVVHPSDELYLFSARMALKLRRPFKSQRVLDELNHIRSSGDGNELRAYGMSRELDQLASYLHAEGAADKSLLDRYSRQVRRSLTLYRRLPWWKFFGWSLGRSVYRYYIEFKRRILKRYGAGRRKIPKGGFIVAFVGPDGCGKTSAVARMEKQFAIQMNVTRVFLGNGRSGARWHRKMVFALFGAKARFRGHKVYREDKSSATPPWYYKWWIALCVRDKLKDLGVARSARANGGLVLSDRWPQPHLQNIFDGPRLEGNLHWAASYEHKFHAQASDVRPDLLFRFNVTPEVAAMRKPGEMEIGKLAELAGALSKIDWLADEIVDIDADMEMEQIDSVLRDAIWRKIRATS